MSRSFLQSGQRTTTSTRAPWLTTNAPRLPAGLCEWPPRRRRRRRRFQKGTASVAYFRGGERAPGESCSDLRRLPRRPQQPKRPATSVAAAARLVRRASKKWCTSLRPRARTRELFVYPRLRDSRAAPSRYLRARSTSASSILGAEARPPDTGLGASRFVIVNLGPARRWRRASSRRPACFVPGTRARSARGGLSRAVAHADDGPLCYALTP